VEDSVAVEDALEASVPVEAAFGAAEAALSVVVECLASSLWAELETLEPAVSVAAEPTLPLVAEVFLIAFPGNAWAAITDRPPVTVTLPAISQRLMRVSLRSARSLAFTS
jgi:hypothetical protein